MGTENISIRDFESRTTAWVPHSHTGRNPMQWYLAPFECGCGETHDYNNVYTPIVLDSNEGVAIFSPGCQYLIAVQFKGFFKFTIKTMFSCKLDFKEKDYGLEERNILNELKTLISRFKDDWKEGHGGVIPPIDW